jgi:cobalamin biosynthesis Mg chelatase CobN
MDPDKYRAIAERYRERHPERIKEIRERYLKAHPGRSVESQRKKYWENPEAARERNKAYYRQVGREKELARARLRTHGVTNDVFLEMREQQGDLCAACGATFVGMKTAPCIDHDHATGLVRELLCPGCNFAIGHCCDSPSRLRACADYLERHQRGE